MAQIALISIHLPLIYNLIPFSLIVPHQNKFSCARKLFFFRTKINFLPHTNFPPSAQSFEGVRAQITFRVHRNIFSCTRKFIFLYAENRRSVRTILKIPLSWRFSFLSSFKRTRQGGDGVCALGRGGKRPQPPPLRPWRWQWPTRYLRAQIPWLQK